MKQELTPKNELEMALVTDTFRPEEALEGPTIQCRGPREIAPECVFHFPDGILGFERAKKYVFMMNEKSRPFLFMQSLDEPDLSFVCVQTFMLRPDYALTLTPEQSARLALESQDDALVLSLVTVKKDFSETTANLMSPVVINMKSRVGGQFVSSDASYPVRFKIWEAIEERTVVSKAV